MTFFQVKSLNCLQFFFRLWGKKKLFPPGTPQFTVPYVTHGSSSSGDSSAFSSDGSQFVP